MCTPFATRHDKDIADIITKERSEYKSTRHFAVDLPNRLIARIPAALSEDKTIVIVRTKYTKGDKPLNAIREIVFKLPCTGGKVLRCEYISFFGIKKRLSFKEIYSP